MKNIDKVANSILKVSANFGITEVNIKSKSGKTFEANVVYVDSFNADTGEVYSKEKKFTGKTLKNIFDQIEKFEKDG